MSEPTRLRRVAYLGAFVASAVAVTTAQAEPPVPLRADHPLLGHWTFFLPDGRCTETHLVRPDGTTIVTSGDEVSESVVEVDDRPTDGVYRWVDRVVRNNGKADCAGSHTPIGDVATSWIRFSADGERLVVCADRETTRCFGPLVRARSRAPA